MSYQITPSSLTPSRPAPQAPIRRAADASSDIYASSVSSSSLSSVGYGSVVSMASSSSSLAHSPYASSYSGIGGSPNRPNSDNIFNSHIVRSGTVSIKEDGFASWLWRPKFLVLTEQSLSIHKNEVRLASAQENQPTNRPPLIHPSVRSPTIHRLAPRHFQRRTNRSQALLSSSRN